MNIHECSMLWIAIYVTQFRQRKSFYLSPVPSAISICMYELSSYRSWFHQTNKKRNNSPMHSDWIDISFILFEFVLDVSLRMIDLFFYIHVFVFYFLLFPLHRKEELNENDVNYTVVIWNKTSQTERMLFFWQWFHHNEDRFIELRKLWRWKDLEYSLCVWDIWNHIDLDTTSRGKTDFSHIGNHSISPCTTFNKLIHIFHRFDHKNFLATW